MIILPNLYAGKSRNQIVGAAIYGGDTVTAGLWNREETMLSKYIYHVLSIQDSFSANDDFCGNATESTSTLGDIAVELERFIIDETICKAKFRGTFHEDNPLPAIDRYVDDLMRVTKRALENVRWSGNIGSTIPYLAKQNGVVQQLVAGASFISVAGASAAAITNPATVIAELNKAIALVPGDVRWGGNFKIIMAPNVFTAYQQAAFADGNLNAGLVGIQGFVSNSNPALGSVGTFLGHPVYIANGLSAETATGVRANAHVVLMGAFGDAEGRNSNLILATDLVAQSDEMKVFDLQPTTTREKWAIMFDYSQGIGVANQNQIVMYR